MADDSFSLYDLRVTVDTVSSSCTCSMSIGAAFTLHGCKLHVEAPDGFCVYALQSTLPLLPAKQRQNHPADWMESDSFVMCPGSTCALRMRIDRIGQTVYKHDDVSEIKWRDLAHKAGT